MVLNPVQKDQRNQSYYLFLNQQMKNSPQGFARSVMLASVDKCSWMNVERQERKKIDFRFLRKPFLLKYKLVAATHTGPRYIICHREIIFCLNRFPETKPAYQNEHTETFVGMFVGAVLTGKKIFWSSCFSSFILLFYLDFKNYLFIHEFRWTVSFLLFDRISYQNITPVFSSLHRNRHRSRHRPQASRRWW